MDTALQRPQARRLLGGSGGMPPPQENFEN